MHDDEIKSCLSRYADVLRASLERMDISGVADMARILLDAYARGRQIFVMGNGGSGATASHFACDLNKGVSFALKRRFRVICLNDNIPTMLAYANDCSYEDIFIEQLRNFLGSEDVVIGFSSKGNSRNILKAMDYAKSLGAKTIGLTGADGGRLRDLSALALIVPSEDTQKIEDVHLVITHMILQVLFQELHGPSFSQMEYG